MNSESVTWQDTPTPPNYPSSSPGPDIRQNIVDRLKRVPTGRLAYGAWFEYNQVCDIDIDGESVLRFPFNADQVARVKDFVRHYTGTTGWEQALRSPTWYIAGKHVTVRDPSWDAYLRMLRQAAGEYLGFSDLSRFRIGLHGLYLWERESLFRDYHNKRCDPSRVATLLIILNRDYTGGDIAICHSDGGNGMLFSPASAPRGNQFLILSHSGASYDALPLESGFRLGLSYDIGIEYNRGFPIWRHIYRKTEEAVSSLHSLIVRWRNATINAETMDNGAGHPNRSEPLLFVLERVYPPDEMNMGTHHALTATDSSRILVVQSLQTRNYHPYRLRACLVTAEVFSYEDDVFTFK